MSRIVLALGLALSVAAPGFAQLQVAQAPSLNLAPVDCAFYGVSLRGREQYERLVNSRAIKKLMSSSFVQLGITQLKTQLENEPDLAQVRELLAMPENKELLKVLADGMSREVFSYGDAGIGELFQVLNRFSGAMRGAQMEMIANGGDEKMMQLRILQFFLDNQKSLEIPVIVLGMHVKDKGAAARQLARLKELRPLLEDSPLAGAAKIEQVNGREMLTLNIKGSMLPIEQLESEFDFNTEEGEKAVKDLMDLIRSRTLSLSVGLQGNYLVFSIGPSTTHLASMGKGETLAQNPKLRPVARHANKPLVSIQYVSGEFLKAATSASGQFNDMAQMISGAVALAPIGEDVKDAIRKDAQKMAADLEKMMPEVGAVTSVSYTTPRGYEGFAYSWSETRQDASKVLSILNHVGGDPIMFAAGRAKDPEANPEAAAYWAGRMDYYMNQLVLPNLPGPQQQTARDLLRKFKPLLARAAKINRELLTPSLDDNQAAFVLDGKLLSAQPHRAMPRPENQLPLPEMAMVIGVSDAAKLSQAMDEYFKLGDDMIDAAREVFPQVPPLKMPRPIPQKMGENTVHSYPIALLLGLDFSIAPNGGSGNGVAVMSFTPETTNRLITENPVTQSSPLLNTYQAKPLGSAVHVNFSKLLSMAGEWANYVVDIQNPGDDSVDVIKREMNMVIDVLSCMREITAVTYEESGVTVTHSEVHFKDLPE